MDCVNHVGVSASAFCQSCGKPLCSECVRNAAAGQVFCEPCRATWQAYQQPFVVTPSGGPNPAAAAVLGIIPGVGAMYNGQFFKGLIHVVVFAALISITDHFGGIFGLFIPAWVLYQAFEAFHTAKAMRDGQPLPDPLRLNELGSWLNLGTRPGPSGPAAPFSSGSATTGQSAPGQVGYQPPNIGQSPPPYQQGPYQGSYQAPYTPPGAGYGGPNVPPIPPISPNCWGPPVFRRKEPIGAIVLIGLGMLFLLGQLNIFQGRLWDFAWPLGLIALGAWLVVRRLGDSQGGSK